MPPRSEHESAAQPCVRLLESKDLRPLERESLKVRGRLQIEKAELKYEIRNLAYHARQFASEFLSVAGFVEIAKAMVKNSENVARDEYLQRRNAEC
jgi:hypothetical protein